VVLPEAAEGAGVLAKTWIHKLVIVSVGTLIGWRCYIPVPHYFKPNPYSLRPPVIDGIDVGFTLLHVLGLLVVGLAVLMVLPLEVPPAATVWRRLCHPSSWASTVAPDPTRAKQFADIELQQRTGRHTLSHQVVRGLLYAMLTLIIILIVAALVSAGTLFMPGDNLESS